MTGTVNEVFPDSVETTASLSAAASEIPTVWHVNSTARGGGVAELLVATMGAHRRNRVPARWLATEADPEFFALTKRLHHRLHGSVDSFGRLGAADSSRYERTTESQARHVLQYVEPGDICVLHDPQTLGMAPHLIDAGIPTAWRCHIGTTTSSSSLDEAWLFLQPYLRQSMPCAFSVPSYIPPDMAAMSTMIIPPAIDPHSAKNQFLGTGDIDRILADIGLYDGFVASGLAAVQQIEHLPRNAQVVLQVSRWDPLKDMRGVLDAFALSASRGHEAHLVLAGPDPQDIPDDPEGAEIYHAVRTAWEELPVELRRRCHLVTLSLKNSVANARIVNALQRRATVVVQKSLQEGFGLTVTEAMWKAKPIVASRVGGIRSQIRSGVEGLLIDPADIDECAEAIAVLLADDTVARSLGRAARRRCRDEFVVDKEFARYTELYDVLSGQYVGSR
ncbi:glycosyltransferase [Nocardia altamirensis]|uniref:glycosyltransferase n=1 Tax=Nocardia altamirensis TaxID=472158 RepID=UPI0008402190|nr:glycosyltransferase [Nocardia altamirensis]